MKIKLKKISKNIKIPSYAHSGDAGLDLYSQESYNLMSGKRHEFVLGFALEVPEGYVGLVWDKSGLSFKHGLHCLGGVVDSTYRGEVKIMLVNLGGKPYRIEKGDKIAQLLIQPISHTDIEVTQKLKKTLRGSGSFGSTGRK